MQEVDAQKHRDGLAIGFTAEARPVVLDHVNCCLKISTNFCIYMFDVVQLIPYLEFHRTIQIEGVTSSIDLTCVLCTSAMFMHLLLVFALARLEPGL